MFPERLLHVRLVESTQRTMCRVREPEFAWRSRAHLVDNCLADAGIVLDEPLLTLPIRSRTNTAPSTVVFAARGAALSGAGAIWRPTPEDAE